MGQLDALFEKSKEASKDQVLPSPHNIPDSSHIDAILGSTSAPVGGPQKPAISSTAKDTIEGVIAMMDMATPVIVRWACAKYRIRFTDALTAQCVLSEKEKSILRVTGIGAAPFFERYMQKSEYIALFAFGASYIMMIRGKIDVIVLTGQPLPPPKEEVIESQPETPGAPDSGSPERQKRVYNQSGKFRGVAQARRKKASVTSTATGNGVQA